MPPSPIVRRSPSPTLPQPKVSNTPPPRKKLPLHEASNTPLAPVGFGRERKEFAVKDEQQKELFKEHRREVMRSRRAGSLPTPQAVSDQVTRCESVIPTTEIRCLLNVHHRMWAAERDGHISIRDVASGEVEHTLPVTEVEFCWCMQLVNDTVWAGFSTGMIRVYNAETFQCTGEIHQHAGGVYCLAFHEDKVYSGSNDFEIFQWNPKTMEFLRQYSGHKNSVRCLLVSGLWLYSGSDDHTIRIWDRVNGDLVREVPGNRGGVLAMALCGNDLWAAGEDGAVRVWDANSGELRHNMLEHKGRVGTLLDLGDRIWTAGVDKTICCWNTETYELVARHTEHTGYINTVAVVSQCSKFQLWSTSNDKTIRLWASEGQYRYASQGSPQREDSTSEVRLALEARAADLERRLQEEQTARSADRVAAEESLQSLRGEVEVAKGEGRALVADVEQELQKEQMRAVELIKTLEDARRRLMDNDTNMAVNRKEITDVEAKCREVMEQRAALVQERDAELSELRQALQARDGTISELKGVILQRDTTQAELNRQVATLQTNLETKRREMLDLQSDMTQARAETSSAERERERIQGQIDHRNTEIAGLKEHIEEWKRLLNDERETCDGLRQKLRTIEERSQGGVDEVNTLRDELKGRDDRLTQSQEEVAALQAQMKELDTEKEEYKQKIVEFEFVIQSRSELVRQIWDLFCDISNAKKRSTECNASPAIKHLRNDVVSRELSAIVEAINLAKVRAKRVVANYLTEVEKLHLGTSPYYFPPDEDAAKYRIADSNPEVLKKMCGKDIRRAGQLAYVKPKGDDEGSAKNPPSNDVSHHPRVRPAGPSAQPPLAPGRPGGATGAAAPRHVAVPRTTSEDAVSVGGRVSPMSTSVRSASARSDTSQRSGGGGGGVLRPTASSANKATAKEARPDVARIVQESRRWK